MSAPLKFSVMFDCNSHHNGGFNGVVSKAEICCRALGFERLISLDGPIDLDDEDLDGTTKFEIGPAWFYLDGKRFRYRTHSQWVGNWCWDAFLMDAGWAVFLLRHLMAEGWDVMEAESSLFEKWKAGTPLTNDDLEETAK